MPRKSDRLPAYQLHKATGQACVKISGRFFYLGQHNTPESHAEYNRIIGEWITLGRPTEYRDRLQQKVEHRRTVKELILAYWEWAQTYYVKNGEPTGELGCLRSILRILRELYGETAIDDFGPLALKTARHEMIQAGLSRQYINKQILRARKMFRWGVENELVRADISAALQAVAGLRKNKSPALEKPPIRPVDEDVIKATLAELDPTLQAMVRLQRLTGMRPQEVCLLTPEQIDRTGEIWLYRPQRHKTEHRDLNRIVPMGPKAQEILLPFLLRGASEYCFQPPRSHRGYYYKDSYRERIQKACRRAFPAPPGLSDEARAEWDKAHRWAPNQLRHSAGSEIRAKFGLEAAQVVLGHTNADTTQIYAERDLKLAMDVARRLG